MQGKYQYRGHVIGGITLRLGAEIWFYCKNYAGQIYVRLQVEYPKTDLTYGEPGSHPDHGQAWHFKVLIPKGFDEKMNAAEFFVTKMLKDLEFHVVKPNPEMLTIELHALVSLYAIVETVKLFTSQSEYEDSKTEWLQVVFFFARDEPVSYINEVMNPTPVPATAD